MAEPPAAVPISNLDVLVVDDNGHNLTAIEAAIGDLAPNLVMASSGEEALRALLERDFSLILLDVQMPGLDGLETARLIRAREKCRGIPIIFVTAFEENEGKVLRGYELGAVDFLFKPIVTEVLRAKVNVFVDLRRQAERLRELERMAFDHRLEQERHRFDTELMERKMADQRRINEDLERAHQKKNEFLAMLGHELRNPIAPILTTLELMKLKGLEDAELGKARDAAERQVRHLVRLVDDLLDIARIDRGKLVLQRAACDLRDLATQAIQTIQAAAGAKKHEVTADLPADPVWVLADEVRIVQAIGNLLNNAVRYVPEGGKIAIRLTATDDEAVVKVKDDGPGIDPELLENVFDMFMQAGQTGQGLGLGLSLVHRLVSLHDGSVEAFSDGPGHGSCFTIRLPLGDAGTTITSTRPPSSDEPRPAAKVLLVDDDDDIRESMVTLLEALGHQVVAAADGEGALALVERERPDVAIIDIGLPDVSGTEIARRVTAGLGDARPFLVAVTGFGQESHRREALEAGFDAHLVKPATLDQIADAIRRGLNARDQT